jgi:hypothetical protein
VAVLVALTHAPAMAAILADKDKQADDRTDAQKRTGQFTGRALSIVPSASRDSFLPLGVSA